MPCGCLCPCGHTWLRGTHAVFQCKNECDTLFLSILAHKLLQLNPKKHSAATLLDVQVIQRDPTDQLQHNNVKEP